MRARREEDEPVFKGDRDPACVVATVPDIECLRADLALAGIRLSELLATNRKLSTVYVLKEDRKHLWDYWHAGYARRFREQSYSRAIRSRIEPLKRFARRRKEYLPRLLAHCRWRLLVTEPSRRVGHPQSGPERPSRPRRRGTISAFAGRS